MSAVLHRRQGAVLIAPLTLFLLAMLGLPLAIDCLYAVSRVTFATLRQPSLQGFGNFATVLRDPGFWQAMGFSLRFAVVASVAQLVLGLGLAVFLAPLFALAPWLMAVLMLPMMVAPALVGLMYRLLLQDFVGIVPNTWTNLFGEAPAFLNPGTAFWTLATIEVLQWTPFALLILYSAYAAVPGEVREAAALDGAGPLRRLAHIDLPWMMPTIAITFFFRFIDSFRVFDNVYVLTGSGAGGSTTTISIFIYEAFFRHNDIGVAVAASLILLAMSFGVLVLLLRLCRVAAVKRRHAWMLVRIAVFALAAFALNFPLIATVVTSLKGEAEIGANPTLTVEAPTLENYRHIRDIADRFDILHYLGNSFAAAGLGSLLALLLAFPAAYAIARSGVGARWLLPLVTSLRAVPLIIFSIPIYLVYQQVHLLDTRIGLALILCLVNLPLVLVLLVNSLNDLPLGIEEAARMDGAGTTALLLRVVLPLSVPVVASALILSFIYAWNEFLFGLMLTTERAVPITVGPRSSSRRSGGGIRWGVASAVMVVSVLPPLLVSLLAYRLIGRSLMAGAVKG